jgi:restriction endonuclease S subunit
MSKGIIESRLRLYPIYFLAFKTIIPPLNEQQAIVAYIEKKCEKIDKLASELQSEIDYLKEYKQRLIADCVTGQVNVSGV